MSAVFTLIDGLNLIRRVYAAVPGENGHPEHDEGVLGSLDASLVRLLSDTGATHALCVMEGAGPTWRQVLHPPYKAERAPMPEALASLLERIEALFARRGVPSIRVDGHEADDVLASVAVRVAKVDGMSVVVTSTDKSLLGLIEHGVRIRHHFERRYLDREFVRDRYGVEPGQMASWLALVGDRSQGIPGVAGIGAKTAAELLGRFGDIEALLGADPEELTPRQARSLAQGHADARLSLRLTTLRTDVSTGMNLRACRLPGRDDDTEPDG